MAKTKKKVAESFGFTDDQRRRLEGDELVPAQIEQLEEILPRLHATLKRLSVVNSVGCGFFWNPSVPRDTVISIG